MEERTMRIGALPASGPPPTAPAPSPPPSRDAPAVADLFVGVFRRDLAGFYPQAVVTPDSSPPDPVTDPHFQLSGDEGGPLWVDLFGVRYRVDLRDSPRHTRQDLRMVRAIGAVLSLRHQHLFQVHHTSRLELYRGGSEDHYVAAFVEPWAYASTSSRPSRIASTIHTLRTAALSTYENRRVSTGALLLGVDDPDGPSAPDALPYGWA